MLAYVVAGNEAGEKPYIDLKVCALFEDLLLVFNICNVLMFQSNCCRGMCLGTQ